MRTAGYVTTSRSLRTDTLAWRLYEKGKRLAWDPADIDFTQDAADWAAMNEAPRRIIARLAAVFMTGEEAVTLDIVPLLGAISAEGRLEEAMFLTTFLSDEAHHAELFRRWFDAVGFDHDLGGLLTPVYRGIFDEELPRVMGRLNTDRSPEAVLDAALYYNQFVEGVLAMTGYWAWHRIFEAQDILPGMRRALELIQRDERRHIAYGTFLCRRIIAAHPDLWPFVETRMAALEDVGMSFVSDLGTAIITELSELPQPELLLASGEGSLASEAARVMAEFVDYGRSRLAGRLKVIGVARTGRVEDIERDSVVEDLEAEFERE